MVGKKVGKIRTLGAKDLDETWWKIGQSKKKKLVKGKNGKIGKTLRSLRKYKNIIFF